MPGDEIAELAFGMMGWLPPLKAEEKPARRNTAIGKTKRFLEVPGTQRPLSCRICFLFSVNFTETIFLVGHNNPHASYV
jgi:hypothetical protein